MHSADGGDGGEGCAREGRHVAPHRVEDVGSLVTFVHHEDFPPARAAGDARDGDEELQGRDHGLPQAIRDDSVVSMLDAVALGRACAPQTATASERRRILERSDARRRDEGTQLEMRSLPRGALWRGVGQKEKLVYSSRTEHAEMVGRASRPDRAAHAVA